MKKNYLKKFIIVTAIICFVIVIAEIIIMKIKTPDATPTASEINGKSVEINGKSVEIPEGVEEVAINVVSEGDDGTAVVLFGRQLWRYANDVWNLVSDYVIDTYENYYITYSNGEYLEHSIDRDAEGKKVSTLFYWEHLYECEAEEEITNEAGKIKFSEREFEELQNTCKEGHSLKEGELYSGRIFFDNSNIGIHLPYRFYQKNLWNSRRSSIINLPGEETCEWVVIENSIELYQYGTLIRTYDTKFSDARILCATENEVILLSGGIIYHLSEKGQKQLSNGVISDFSEYDNKLIWLEPRGKVFQWDGENHTVVNGPENIIAIHLYDGVFHLLVEDGDTRADHHSHGWDSIRYE